MNKASAYILEGDKVIGEMRQCAHCQYSWLYKPRSGKKRGVCLKCMGLLCGRPECMAGCAPIKAIFEQDDRDYVMNESGVMVKRD